MDETSDVIQALKQERRLLSEAKIMLEVLDYPQSSPEAAEAVRSFFEDGFCELPGYISEMIRTGKINWVKVVETVYHTDSIY